MFKKNTDQPRQDEIDKEDGITLGFSHLRDFIIGANRVNTELGIQRDVDILTSEKLEGKKDLKEYMIYIIPLAVIVMVSVVAILIFTHYQNYEAMGQKYINAQKEVSDLSAQLKICQSKLSLPNIVDEDNTTRKEIIG